MAVPDVNMNEIVWDSATLYYGKFDLTNIDTTKAFSLEIIGDTTLTYSSLSAAQTDGYVKIDSNTNTYYVDLTNI